MSCPYVQIVVQLSCQCGVFIYVVQLYYHYCDNIFVTNCDATMLPVLCPFTTQS
jgi:hypothetical protein